MGRRHVDDLRSLIDAYRECEDANEMVLRTRMELYEVSSVANAMQTGDPSKSQLDRIVQRADCHLQYGAKGKDAALVTAAGMGHVAVAMLLLGSGANAHATSEENGFSVILEYVALNGDDAELDPGAFLKMMALLLSHGADLDDELFSAMNPNISEKTYDACVACFEQWRKQRGHTPLVEVPVEVFRRGADAVKTYFAEWEASQTVFARSKICVVGPSTWGKTSLVKTLTSGIPTTENREDRTIGIDLFTWTFSSRGETRGGKPVEYEVTFWDFGGQDVYRGAYSIFYSQRSLFLFCVDLTEYARVLKTEKLDDELELAQFFNDNILRWFRLVFARQSQAKVVLVGTKSDAESLTGDLIASVQEDVSLRLEEWSQKSKNNAGKAEWLITSSKDTLVADRARQELEQIVVSSDQGFTMPDKYFAVLKYVRGLRSQAGKYSMEGRLKHIFRNDKALRRELKVNGGNNAPTMKDCKSIFQILHDLGDLLYFEKTGSEFLESLVIVDPRVIVDLVRQIVRHDRIEEDHMAALQTRGLVPHVLLKTLPLWKDVKEELTFALKELLQYFRIAYPAEQSRMTPEADMIVPALWTLHEPVNQTSAQFKEALQGFRDASGDENLLTFNWEYEFPGDTLPEWFYEEVVAGLSILSTVAPSGWIISSSDLHSALGIDNAIGKAVKVYNLIKGTSLKTNGFIDTSADCRLDTQRSRDLLRKLLEIHCSGQFEPRDIPSLSHLNCGIIENSGIHVWAAQDELEKYRDAITPRADFTSPTQVQAQIVGSLQGFLVIRRVTGLTDWNWREMYVEWQLVDGAGTQIAGGRTSSNPDNSKAPQWSDKKHFPIDSIEDLRKMTLTATARRPSRWVFSPVK
ncbi:hypothetical protein BBJ29_000773 [Phytophthora kernoviae]|uniref:non-specific serine/threonine protein kinase n=1 Tax=Phytophthora kernoviae TaxID=325452 RepID=A0A3R7JFX8_9STRA|nr:hypothetical protein BBJ29_000773 [Phytophthora kernoviae]